jgi:pimeloyl-ACP methyl ester carboxylesterase
MNMKNTLPDQVKDSRPHCQASRIERFSRGCLSILGVLLHPLGRFTGALLDHLRAADRLEHGLVLVLPGVEGESCINHSIARGLADGGVQSAIEIFDWTTGVILLFLYHLRGWRRNIAQADRLVRRIVEFRRAYPGRPVHLVGHSGGGAMAVLAIERLPANTTLTSAILLNAAISPKYDLSTALAKTESGIWSFRSAFDVLFDGIGTSIAGTMDGRHTPATGMIGFRPPSCLSDEGRELYRTHLHQVPFQLRMCGDFNFGGHMGSTNRVFVAERIAPLLKWTAP